MYRIIGSILAVALLFSVASTVMANTERVQMSASGHDSMGAEQTWYRLGQRLTIPDRKVTSIGYHVRRVGNPAGDVIISLRDASTDEVIFSAIWGDAGELQQSGSTGYCEVALAAPMRVSGDVRICAEYYGGNSTDYCVGGYYSGNKVSGEWYTNYLHDGRWHDIGEAEEGSYCYDYVKEDVAPDGEAPASAPRLHIVFSAVGLGILVWLWRRSVKRD